MLNKLLIFCLMVLLLTAGCKEANKPPTSTPTEGVGSVPTINMPPLHLIYIPGGSKTYMIERWQKLADYLTQITGIPIEADTAKTYSNFEDSFRNKKSDIGFVGGVIYVRLKKQLDVIPLVSPIINGKVSTRGLIIVREDSGLKNLKALKGKSILFVDKESTTGYLFPRVMMADHGIKKLDDYFSKVQYTQDHLSSIISVYNGYFDAAVVSEFVFSSEEAKKYKGIKVLMETENIPPGCFAVRKDLQPEYIQKLKEAFLNIGKTPQTDELLKSLRVEGYVEAKDSDYDSTREAMKKLSELQDEKKEKK